MIFGIKASTLFDALLFVILGSVSVFQGGLLPSWFLHPLLVWIPWSLMRTTSLVRSLCKVFIAGFCLDCMSTVPLGTYTLALFFVTYILFLHRHRVQLEENPLYLALFTYIASCLLPWAFLLSLFIFDRSIPFRGTWPLVDLLLVPLGDGVWGLALGYTLKYVTVVPTLWRTFCSRYHLFLRR
jgi:cell shape-determining protein MreD